MIFKKKNKTQEVTSLIIVALYMWLFDTAPSLYKY